MTNAFVLPATVLPLSAVDPTNPSIWYPMHEGTGTSLACAFGTGPTLTLNGTSPAATGWANAGCFTPNGTDHQATAAQQAYADNVLNLASLVTGGMLLVGCELQFAGANAATSYMVGHGRDATTAGYGGWFFGVNGSDQPTFLFRGQGAAGTVSGAMGLNIADTHTSPVQMLLALWIEQSVYLRAELRTSATGASVGSAQYDLTGLTIPTAALDGMTLMAKRISAGSWNSFSAGRLNNVWAQKRATLDAGVAATAWADMTARRREFPGSLRG